MSSVYMKAMDLYRVECIWLWDCIHCKQLSLINPQLLHCARHLPLKSQCLIVPRVQTSTFPELLGHSFQPQSSQCYQISLKADACQFISQIKTSCCFLYIITMLCVLLPFRCTCGLFTYFGCTQCSCLHVLAPPLTLLSEIVNTLLTIDLRSMLAT